MDNIESNIILISGTGRSGTNITKKILSKHSKVSTLPFEHRFIVDPDGIIDFYNSMKYSWSPYISDHKIKNLFSFLRKITKRNRVKYIIGTIIQKIDSRGKYISTPSYFGWEMSAWFPRYDTHLTSLFNELVLYRYRAVWPGVRKVNFKNKMDFVTNNILETQKSLSRFILNNTNDLLIKQNKELFVEDNTWNLLYADTLVELIPNVKFVHVIRNPLDVIASLMKQRWTPNTLSDVIIYYSSIMNRIIKQSENLNNKQLLTIKLETLVESPDETIKNICDFCNLEFDKKLLDVYLDNSSLGRWQIDFDEAQKNELKRHLKKHLEYFNY